MISTRVAKSNNGVAFEAQLDSSGGGVYTGADPLTDGVVEEGNSVQGFGGPTVNFVLISQNSLNDSGQLIMLVAFSNGKLRIIRADPLAQLQLLNPVILDVVAAMLSFGNASLSQVIGTPINPGDLMFDYLFPTTTGTLVVRLGDIELARISAPNTLAENFETARIFVDPGLSLTSPSTVALEFLLEGGGVESGLLLNNIAFEGLLNGDFQTGSLSDWRTAFSGPVWLRVLTLKKGSLSRNRPWRASEKVEWSGTLSSMLKPQNHRHARFRRTSSYNRRSERMP